MPTLKDVALKCGVSTATVSYVLNNSPRQVLPETRERVLKAIREMGYQPNAYARAMKGKRTPVIGVVFPHITVPFSNVYFGPVLEGIVASATEQRMPTMLFTGCSPQDDSGIEQEFYGICDGFLLVAPTEESRVAASLSGRGIPAVSIGSRLDLPGVSSIDADNRTGAQMAANHLLSLGHRKIGIVLSSKFAAPAERDLEDHLAFSKERQEGFNAGLRAADIEPDLKLTATIWDDGPASIASIKRLLVEESPTALFGTFDGAAYRTLEACRELGLRVPEDVSVMGFDDIPNAELQSPPLTTIRQPVHDIGFRAVNMLCEQIRFGPDKVQHLLVPTELITRRSTAAI